uniref:Uncharacterized protein n=1 Tax=Ditylenchus dipsaci TaxID=166011 RepID=A0A915E5Z0_9BILA
MLKANYGKELLHSSRPISTSLYRASSPAAAEGAAEPASSSTITAEKPEETAAVEIHKRAAKPRTRAVKTTEAGAQEAKQKDKLKMCGMLHWKQHREFLNVTNCSESWSPSSNP